MKIALVGNPNVGKTSLYNRLTHSFEHVGNWHGVTVDSALKTISFDGTVMTICDLPGIYSLTVFSLEEAVSRDAILFGKNDLVVCVCEVNNLYRNLYLALQLMELGIPVLVAVNMIDELKRSKRTLNTSLLSKRLGVDIITLSAKKRGSGEEVLSQIKKSIKLAYQKKDSFNLPYLDKLPINALKQEIRNEAEALKLPSDFIAIKLLENDNDIIKRLKLSKEKLTNLKPYLCMEAKVASARYDYIDSVMDGVISSNDNYINGKSHIDRYALNKFFALPLFFCVMAFVFFLTFAVFGRFFSGLIELAISKLLYNLLMGAFNSIKCPIWISAIILDGIISGIGGILTFLPQVVLLFFFLALLEDSGYISRVAFMTDGLLSKVGLSGRSGFSMLMGFGCSATAIMASRTLEDENMRKKTILITPFMSCSARLPVYSVIAAAFFANGAVIVIFSMYLLGIAVAFLLAAILNWNKTGLTSGKQSFIMELPPYRLPSFERVYQLIKENVFSFIVRVGTVIFALNTILWVLSNFSLMHGYTVGTDYKSIFEVLGTFIAPVFAPLGFGNWKAATSLLGGLAAKEVVISLIESLGGVESVFVGSYPNASALSFMVFTLLYIPCVATISAIKKETSLRWASFCLFVQFFVAYVFSLVFYWCSVLVLY